MQLSTSVCWTHIKHIGSHSPPRKLKLQLPPELDASSTPENAASSVKLLLRRALEKLSKLGPVEDWKVRNVVGRGETKWRFCA